jgi:hypothetical protein
MTLLMHLTRLRLNDRELRLNSFNSKRIYSSFKRPEGLWGPLSLVLNVYRDIKWPRHETGHSPSTNAEAKNVRNYVSASHDVPKARCSINHRDNLAYYLFIYLFIHFLFNDLYAASNSEYSVNNKMERYKEGGSFSLI